jgi:hypothetical protein
MTDTYFSRILNSDVTLVCSATNIAVTATTYLSGTCAGSKLSFASAIQAPGASGIIQKVVLRDKQGAAIDNLAAIYDLILFNADPTLATITNASTFAFNADLSKAIDSISLVGMVPDATGGIITVECSRRFKLSSGTTLYGALVCRGTPTFTSTSDISLDLIIKAAG